MLININFLPMKTQISNIICIFVLCFNDTDILFAQSPHELDPRKVNEQYSSHMRLAS